jgi:hypothetical protein
MDFLQYLCNKANRKRIAGSFLGLVVICAPLFGTTLAANPQTGAARSTSPVQPTPVQLGKELETLAYFTGHWSCQGVFPSNGKQIASEIVFAPDLEGAWLTVRHDDLPPNRFHAFEMWGFDKEAKQFVNFIYDNFGGARKFTSSGWSENTLIWAGESHTASPAALERFVFRRADSGRGPGQFVVNYEVKRGSADWAIGDSLTCRK